MPTFLSREAKDLLKKLFKRIPSHRLGAGVRGTEDVKAQSFFARINWDNLLQCKVQPPFVPMLANGDRPEKYFDKVRDGEYV
jgi:serine/threonine protein kinase